MNNTLHIPFDGSKLIVVKDKNSIVYTAVRPIVDGIGLDWKSQYRKLTDNSKKFSCGHMTTTGSDGNKYNMLCIPIKKLNGWLFSINPEKVKPELRDSIIKYQEECFVALYEYWNRA